MHLQSFAVRLKRIVHLACERSFVSGLSPLAHAFSNWRGTALAHVPAAPRPLDCLLFAMMAAAVALVALLCSAASHLGFAQVGRIGGWLP
ncbi:hypothetical protein WR30_27000 [Burkholderia contaminans FFH2055]|uniref:Uncharacterized protein n=1 Tax=Burkholderia contaminans TaxID=488447 RepID=A0A3N8MLA5_9BURK|nr:hypothetical protein [Burkholderia contaminans]ELK6467095.1 hypothetical protein [Burkholderia contaminans]KKL34160.1 hypothetical protein WR30_27000 [Burkholderia contaminans FFH2055]MCA7883079.1 hypothetical protein [Burkholderia contaminans]MCA8156066.1 hypothetical protein [Burkholderia contaminans]MEB4632381.1 hypothetical protein [Burkholderia contaminans]